MIRLIGDIADIWFPFDGDCINRLNSSNGTSMNSLPSGFGTSLNGKYAIFNNNRISTYTAIYSGVSEFSFSGRIKLNEINSSNVVWCDGSNELKRKSLYITNDFKVYFIIDNQNISINYAYYQSSLAELMSMNTYHLVYNGNETPENRALIYINGIKKDTTIGGTIPTSTSTGNSGMVYGDYVIGGYNYYANGYFEDFIFYKKALTQRQINMQIYGKKS